MVQAVPCVGHLPRPWSTCGFSCAGSSQPSGGSSSNEGTGMEEGEGEIALAPSTPDLAASLDGVAMAEYARLISIAPSAMSDQPRAARSVSNVVIRGSIL